MRRPPGMVALEINIEKESESACYQSMFYSLKQKRQINYFDRREVKQHLSSFIIFRRDIYERKILNSVVCVIFFEKNLQWHSANSWNARVLSRLAI